MENGREEGRGIWNVTCETQRKDERMLEGQKKFDTIIQEETIKRRNLRYVGKEGEEGEGKKRSHDF